MRRNSNLATFRICSVTMKINRILYGALTWILSTEVIMATGFCLVSYRRFRAIERFWFWNTMKTLCPVLIVSEIKELKFNSYLEAHCDISVCLLCCSASNVWQNGIGLGYMAEMAVLITGVASRHRKPFPNRKLYWCFSVQMQEQFGHNWVRTL